MLHRAPFPGPPPLSESILACLPRSPWSTTDPTNLLASIATVIGFNASNPTERASALALFSDLPNIPTATQISCSLSPSCGPRAASMQTKLTSEFHVSQKVIGSLLPSGRHLPTVSTDAFFTAGMNGSYLSNAATTPTFATRLANSTFPSPIQPSAFTSCITGSITTIIAAGGGSITDGAAGAAGASCAPRWKVNARPGAKTAP
jgi:hypothetical protein